MRIGPLRHRVNIQQPIATQNDFGEEIITWSTLASVWANVLPASGRESYVSAGEQQLAVITHRVQLRYRTDLGPKMRVVWEDRYLDIESVQDPTGKRGFLMVMCRENYEGADAAPVSADYLLDFSDADMSMYLGAL